jgi:hypothetical protein
LGDRIVAIDYIGAERLADYSARGPRAFGL